MGRAHRAVLTLPPAGGGLPASRSEHEGDPEWIAARADAVARVGQLGWRVEDTAPALDHVAEVVLALRKVGNEAVLDRLPHYAEAALSVAEHEVAHASTAGDPAEVMAAVVTGTVLGGALLLAVRLLAHEHVSARAASPP